MPAPAILTAVLAVAPGLVSSFVWLSVVALFVLAVVLYFPRRFSGPMTAAERRATRRVARGRSLIITYATPVAALLGFVLLLPPLLSVHVTSLAAGKPPAQLCAPTPTRWSPLARRVSLEPWTRSVLCFAKHGEGEDALASAVLDAAREGFPECHSELGKFDAWEIASVELTLLELAARSGYLTDVAVFAGPRMHDPDPWDLMSEILEARGISNCLTERAERNGDATEVLRLGRVHLRDDSLEALAVLRGGACEQLSALDARLTAARSGETIATCRMRPRNHAVGCEGAVQRAVQVDVSCDQPSIEELHRQHGGLILSAGYGDAPVRVGRALRISVATADGGLWQRAQNEASKLPAFRRSLSEHGLPSLWSATARENVELRLLPDRIVLERPGAGLPLVDDASDDQDLNQGPFSWSGMIQRPVVRCESNRVEIGISSRFLDPREKHSFDPTTFFALMRTISWSARALMDGACESPQSPVTRGERRPAHTLLTPAKIDAAVATMRRTRETTGLLLLAFSILSLAFALRRSRT